MNGICSKCGLPKDLCVCETLAKEQQRIRIQVEKRRFGKLITVVSGLDQRDIDVREIAKKLKSKLACGGTTKEGVIELQGDHLQKAKRELIKLGFAPQSIESY